MNKEDEGSSSSSVLSILKECQIELFPFRSFVTQFCPQWRNIWLKWIRHIQSLDLFLLEELLTNEVIEEQTWRILFYQYINIIRSKLRDACDPLYPILLEHICNEGISFYKSFLSFFNESILVNDTFAYKILIHVGDLNRYLEELTDNKNDGHGCNDTYQEAKIWYYRAYLLCPDKGQAFNQLALCYGSSLISNQNINFIETLYFHLKSFYTNEPFPLGKENTQTWMKKVIHITNILSPSFDYLLTKWLCYWFLTHYYIQEKDNDYQSIEHELYEMIIISSSTETLSFPSIIYLTLIYLMKTKDFRELLFILLRFILRRFKGDSFEQNESSIMLILIFSALLLQNKTDAVDFFEEIAHSGTWLESYHQMKVYWCQFLNEKIRYLEKFMAAAFHLPGKKMGIIYEKFGLELLLQLSNFNPFSHIMSHEAQSDLLLSISQLLSQSKTTSLMELDRKRLYTNKLGSFIQSRFIFVVDIDPFIECFHLVKRICEKQIDGIFIPIGTFEKLLTREKDKSSFEYKRVKELIHFIEKRNKKLTINMIIESNGDAIKEEEIMQRFQFRTKSLSTPNKKTIVSTLKFLASMLNLSSVSMEELKNKLVFVTEGKAFMDTILKQGWNAVDPFHWSKNYLLYSKPK